MIHVDNIPGLGRRSFPDGTSTDDIKAAIDKERNFGNEEPNALQGSLIGLGSGINSAGQGLEQLGRGLGEALGTQPKGAEAAYGRGVQAEREQYEKGLQTNQEPVAQTTSGTIGHVIGQALPFTGLAAAGIPEAIAAGAAIGGSAPVEPGQSRLAQTVTGGWLGPAGNLIGRGVGAGVGRLVNNARGEAIAPADQELIDLSNQHDIPIFAHQFPDATNSSVAASYLRRGPSGLVEKEVNQGNQIGEQAKNFTDEMNNELKAANYGGEDGLKSLQIAAEGGYGVKRQKRAQMILDEISQHQDWTDIIQSSGDVSVFKKQLQSDKLYDKVEQIAGKQPVPMNNTILALKNLREKLGDRLGATTDMPELDPTGRSPAELEAITKYFKDIANKNKDPFLRQLDDLTDNINGLTTVNPFTGETSTTSRYGDLRKLRTSTANLVNQAYKGSNSVIGTDDVPYMMELKNGIEADMNGFASTGTADLRSAHQAADKFYKEQLGPYKVRNLATSMASDNSDDLYKRFIQSGNFEGNPTKLYNALDDKGRQAVRYGMVNDAYQKALNADSEGFSAPKFLNALNAKKGARDVFFQGQAKTELDGFTKLLNAVKGSSNAGPVPVTGAMNVPIASTMALGSAGAALGGPAGAATALGLAFGGANGLRWMLTNPTGRNILRSASKLDPNSKAMDALLVRSGNLMKTALTQQGANRASK